MSSSQARPRYESIKSQASSVTPSTWGGPVRPPSPSFSTTTTGSRVNLPAHHMLISRKDLRQSIACFEELMVAAKAYRNALLAMSTATAAFASAMEACSRVKGCRSSNSPLAGAAGLQYLMGNHEGILADTVYRQFEIPLLEALDHYKLVTADRLAAYEKSLHEQSNRIRKTEAENLKVGRRRKRDLQQFRQALAELQRQVDELDAIKAEYHEEVLEGEDELWDTVLGKVAFVIRSQLDFYEKIAGKASDPILEPLVSSIPDPFDSYGPPKEEGQIISVLAPLGMLDPSPKSPRPGISRTASGSGISTPERSTPSKPGPFLTSIISPSKPETSAVLAMGESGWTEEEDRVERARRELSVIDEADRDASSIPLVPDEGRGESAQPPARETSAAAMVGEEDSAGVSGEAEPDARVRNPPSETHSAPDTDTESVQASMRGVDLEEAEGNRAGVTA